MKPTKTYEDCECVKETDMAILVESPDLGEVWIPKSQVDDDSEVYEEGDVGDLIVSEWFGSKLENEGADYFEED